MAPPLLVLHNITDHREDGIIPIHMHNIYTCRGIKFYNHCISATEDSLYICILILFNSNIIKILISVVVCTYVIIIMHVD